MTIPKNRLISGIPRSISQSPVSSAKRSTSAAVSVGAPGRLGNVATPRSIRTSASAIRRSSASSNSSTRCPDRLARSASRSFNAASTVIVAFGIMSLSHDVAKGANCGAKLPFVAQRHDLSPLGWAQIWAHEFSDAANRSRISTFRGRPSLPWAQGVAGLGAGASAKAASNPVAPTTFQLPGNTGVPPVARCRGSRCGLRALDRTSVTSKRGSDPWGFASDIGTRPWQSDLHPQARLESWTSKPMASVRRLSESRVLRF